MRPSGANVMSVARPFGAKPFAKSFGSVFGRSDFGSAPR